MATLNDVKSRFWQFSLKEEGGIVQGIDDINQCIYVILATQKGEDPCDPEFGCSLWDKMDHPVLGLVAEAKRDILQALETYEKRIKVKSITASQPQLGKLVFSINYEFGEDVYSTDFTVNIK